MMKWEKIVVERKRVISETTKFSLLHGRCGNGQVRMKENSDMEIMDEKMLFEGLFFIFN